ncbi:C6 transcription factor [Fusarium subglutinans]|uniref:C6 transcription factor n=1 Tax=Gibberella subglutinans TaxID=42677 RepID=A0A8H5L4L7_GIBSU|nr:C6 transcription factor [Fusarium subglutinans]KAF5585267.1 C6 transcription factor [Fusarium subglutinans]
MAGLESPNERVSFLSRAIEAIQERLQVIEKAFLDVSDKPKNPNDASPHSIATNHESPASFTTFEEDSSFIKETSEASRSATITTPLCGVTSSWTDHGQLERLCQKIYFPVREVPSESMALMHGMLFNVIQEFSQHNNPVFAAYNLNDCADQCKRNFDQYLERYEGLVIPTLENIQTVSMAASRAQDYLYVVNKTLSLVLGQSSNFNDNDIDVEPFSISENLKHWPWDLYTNITIRFAKIQGEVYDKLYSTSTAKHSQRERSHITQDLAMRITSLREELQSLKASDACYSDVLQMAMESADLITYAVLTVVYRAELGFVDSVEISSRCYNAVKFSLESHLKCFTSLDTLLYPSLTPYVIVFTHAIATSDEIGIALLQDTVKPLARLQDLSPGSRRLYEVCRSFLNAAEAIISSQRTVDGLEQNENGSLIFTKNSSETRSYGLGFNEGLPATWSDDASFGTVASGSYNGSNSDTLQFWSSWLGSTQFITDALQLDFTDGGLGGASYEEYWS